MDVGNFHGPPGADKQPRQNHLSYGIICSRFYCNIIDALPPEENYVYALYTPLYIFLKIESKFGICVWLVNFCSGAYSIQEIR